MIFMGIEIPALKCLFPRATSQVTACRHLATATRVKKEKHADFIIEIVCFSYSRDTSKINKYYISPSHSFTVSTA